MKINAAGLALIKSFEGERLSPYQDGAGIWTEGIGHTAGVTQDSPDITDEESLTLLAADVSWAEFTVGKCVSVPLNENQFSALVSLCFNIGAGNFGHSTLLKLLNSGNFTDAAQQFMKWILVKGQPCTGLIRRRSAEKTLFLTPPT